MIRALLSTMSVVALSLCITNQCLAAGASGLGFTQYEAEAATRGGGATTVTMTSEPLYNTVSPEFEASGRSFVKLDATGEYVQFNSVVACDRITVRFCMPDSTSDRTLSVYVRANSSSSWTDRGNIVLNAKYAWLYSAPGEDAGHDSPGSGEVGYHFWDCARLTIPGGAVPSGYQIKLQKDSGDSASYYYIDLIQLETAPNALSQPANSLSITAYGATSNDGSNDSGAIQACLDAARTQGKSVWVPAGLYNLSTRLEVWDVTMQGAGHWHSRFLVNGDVQGFRLRGNAPKLRDVGIFNQVTFTRGTTDYGISAYPNNCSNFVIENCWIQHTGAGMWMSAADHGTIRHNRVYDTYADGISINRGTSYTEVDNNFVIGTGDDCISMLSETNIAGDPTATSNNVHHNTLIAPWWGVVLALRGGGGHTISQNYLAESKYGAAMAINNDTAYNMAPVTSATISNNVIVRGGGQKASNDNRGAIWIACNDQNITNLTFTSNTITKPMRHAIVFKGTSGKTQTSTFSSTTIQMNNSVGYAAVASGSFSGSATLTGTSLSGTYSGTGYNDGASPFDLTPP